MSCPVWKTPMDAVMARLRSRLKFWVLERKSGQTPGLVSATGEGCNHRVQPTESSQADRSSQSTIDSSLQSTESTVTGFPMEPLSIKKKNGGTCRVVPGNKTNLPFYPTPNGTPIINIRLSENVFTTKRTARHNTSFSNCFLGCPAGSTSDLLFDLTTDSGATSNIPQQQGHRVEPCSRFDDSGMGNQVKVPGICSTPPPLSRIPILLFEKSKTRNVDTLGSSVKS